MDGNPPLNGTDDATGDDRRNGRAALGRRRFLGATGAAAAAFAALPGAASATDCTESTDRAADLLGADRRRIAIDYGDFDDPAAVYDVNDNRSGIPPEFVSSPTAVSDQALRTEFANDSKTANLEFRFRERGYEAPTELYTRFYVFPQDIALGQDDTVRMFWAPLTDGDGSSGGGATDGTNGWSNAIGFANRDNSPAPDGYNFFSYSYHMDNSGSGDFEMTDVPVWMDEWNEIECYVRCNSFTNGAAEPDGVMRYWVNDELAYERTDFRFTTSEDNLIEGCGPLGYTVGDGLAGSALLYDGHEIHLPADDSSER